MPKRLVDHLRNSETSLTDVLGEEFGQYKLVRRLGVGGMAETFVAVRRGPSGFAQRVCLKLVLPFFRDDEDFIALFEREARLAAKLRHRNIVGVIDFGDIEGTPYMALELVDGLDLRNILEAHTGHRVPTEYVALLGLELAEALEHAHNPPPGAGIEETEEDVRGIVHRDISPSNVLVSRQGEILLTDFGVAKAMTGKSRKQSAVKGKVPYMSPEQLKAEALDGRADLFALGVVLFEALAGERPYEGAHDPATIMRILNGDHPSLESLAPEAPRGLCDVIERLIEPDREKRPATAAALIEALSDFAPSPRIRLDLGRLVTQLSAEVEQKKAKRGSGRISAKTDVLPEADSGSVPAPPSVEPPSDVRIPESQPPDVGKIALEDTAAVVSPHTPTPVPSRETPGVPAPGQAPAPPAADPVNLVRRPAEGSVAVASGADQHQLLRRPPQPLMEPRPASQRKRKGRWSSRSLLVFAAGLLLVVGGTAALAVAFWPSAESVEMPSPRTTQPKPEPPPKPKVTPEPQPEELPSAVTPEPEPELPAPLEQQAQEPPPTTTAPEPEPPPKPKVTPEPRAKKPPKTTTKSRRAQPKTTQQKPTQPKPEPEVKRPGRLTITVFPWGNIWINGQPWGAAPLTNEPLPPGTYKISVGQRSPTKTQTVQVKPGQLRTVSFDLSE
jgi:serine/threonine protein kinase